MEQEAESLIAINTRKEANLLLQQQIHKEVSDAWKFSTIISLKMLESARREVVNTMW